MKLSERIRALPLNKFSIRIGDDWADEVIQLEADNEALRIKPAESLVDIVLLVEKAMRCLEAVGEGLYTESFDGELTDVFNTLDDALSTLKPQLEASK